VRGSSSERRIWLFVALLGVIGPGVAARPARAMGCHAAERPALGLSSTWEAPAAILRVGHVEPTRAFVPVPCTGDVPGSPTTAWPVERLSQEVVVLPPVAEAPRPRVPQPRLSHPSPLASRLDRPPRPSAPLSGSSSA
jgi:hypothetical protein